MKKRDLYSFERGLSMATFDHPRVTYAINKNKRLVRQTIEDMEKAVEPSEKVKEFNKEREELAKKHCVKDKNGNPKLNKVPDPSKPGKFNMVYDIIGQDDPKSKYRKELEKLEKKFEKELKEQEEKIRQYNEEFLDDESDYKPFMVDIELLEAHEKCPQRVMDLIYWMIKEPKEE